jgi:hypothetical protein
MKNEKFIRTFVAFFNYTVFHGVKRCSTVFFNYKIQTNQNCDTPYYSMKHCAILGRRTKD